MPNWNEKPEQVGPASSGGQWLSLKEGSYKVRLVAPYEYIGYHFDNRTKTSTVCPNREKGDNNCKLCTMLKDGKGKLYNREEANKMQKENPKLKFYYNRPSQKFLTNLLDLDEAEPTVKHCELPYKVVDMLTSYALSDDYGFSELPDWDMTITRKNGDVPTDVTYNVIPARTNRELTPEEAEAVDSATSPKEMVDKKHQYARDEAESEDGTEEETEEEIDIDKVPF